MHIELMIDEKKQLPAGAIEAFEVEFKQRLDHNYPDAKFTVRLANSDGMSVIGGTTHDREVIDVMLQQTWESSDEWFQPDQ